VESRERIQPVPWEGRGVDCDGIRPVAFHNALRRQKQVRGEVALAGAGIETEKGGEKYEIKLIN